MKGAEEEGHIEGVGGGLEEEREDEGLLLNVLRQ